MTRKFSAEVDLGHQQTHNLCFCSTHRGATGTTLFPYTTLFRSLAEPRYDRRHRHDRRDPDHDPEDGERSEEHTSELQSHVNLVCRLQLEKKKNDSQG